MTTRKPFWTTNLVIQIISYAVVIAISFAAARGNISALVFRVEKIETRQQAETDCIRDLSVDVGRLEERIIALQESVDRIENGLEG